MPKKKTPALDPKEQFKRFQEAATVHGLDEPAIQRVEDAFKKLGRQSRVGAKARIKS